MRNPPDDAAGQPAGRRRSHRADPGATRPPGPDSSVFVPGYDSRREPHERAGGPGGSGGPGGAGPAAWYGSSAGGPAARGPVRGYPPVPGQPPPMYPPGPFAAWNRGPASRGRHGGGSSPAPATSGNWQSGRAPEAGQSPSGSYYGHDDGPQTEPGYSALAVSDPAADVTSTQTWQAVGDGRASGSWTQPPRPGGPGSGVQAPGDKPGGGSRLAPWSPQAAVLAAGGTGQLSRERSQPGGGPGLERPSGPARQLSPTGAGPAEPAPEAGGPGAAAGTRGRGADDAGQAAGQDARGPERAGRTSQALAPGRRAATRHGGAQASPAPSAAGLDATAPPGRSRTGSRLAGRSQRKQAISPRNAIAAAVVVVLLAGAALYLVARSLGQHSSPTAAPPTKPKATAAATPSPTPSVSLGPYGYIASRRDDPQPLTTAQLYPASFSAGGVPFVLANSKLSSDCIDAVSGAGIQAAVSAGNCTQVARATYVDRQGGMMGTIGVLNLQAARFALSAAKAAGAANYIAQLRGHTSPSSKIGQGTGIEEASAKGHYLILIWAELTSLKTPKTTAAKAGLAQFMTDLLQDTANVSLTDRMMDGNPSPAPPGT